MNSNYSEIVKRLMEYREKLGLTQIQMSEKLGIDQSHYSKIELGKKIMSWESIESFYEKGGDIDYLVTGQQIKENEKYDILQEMCIRDNRYQFLKLFMWLIEQGNRMEQTVRSLQDDGIRLLKLAERELYSSNIWENIREIENLTQVEMAAALDINIKRYRRIEKAEIKPNLEILYSLYQNYYYVPLVIINRVQFYCQQTNCMWFNLSEQTRKKLHPLLVEGVKIIKECEVGYQDENSIDSRR